MKFFTIILIGYHLLVQPTRANSEIDPQKFLDNVCLVHASSITPVNNIKVAGALINYVAIPFEHAIITRLTLHHCLGGLVREEVMGVTEKFYGVPISMAMPEGHRDAPFIFITPLSTMHQQVYGGQLNDLFVLDEIEYGNETTVLVNENKLTELKEKNPGFPGLIIPFSVEYCTLLQNEMGR